MSVFSQWQPSFNAALADINDAVWGPFTLALLVGTGLYLMIGLRFMPLRQLGYAVRAALGSANRSEGEGEVNAFQGLMTALAATIGTGNVAGVASAISFGGPGSVFWMWLAALLGIATKYSETVLAVHFREVDSLGNHVGGPMYAIRNGLGRRWSWLAALFAIFGTLAGFGIGNGVQAHVMANALDDYGVPVLLTGVVMAVITFLVIIGGIRRIASVASVLVPLMAGVYVIASLVILLAHMAEIPAAFALIFRDAFTGQAAAGGAIGVVIQKGIARGVFSNEAGLGTAPMAQASAKPGNPVLQGSVAMLGTVIDTLVICTMTALVIVISGTFGGDLSDVDLTKAAFSWAFPVQFMGFSWGDHLITFSTITFTATTILGWSFYSERCLEYLAGVGPIKIFRLVWVGVVVLGAVASKEIWTVADILNGLMAFPNLVALLLLSGTVFKLTQNYRFSDPS